MDYVHEIHLLNISSLHVISSYFSNDVGKIFELPTYGETDLILIPVNIDFVLN